VFSSALLKLFIHAQFHDLLSLQYFPPSPEEHRQCPVTMSHCPASGQSNPHWFAHPWPQNPLPQAKNTRYIVILLLRVLSVLSLKHVDIGRKVPSRMLK